MDSQHWQEPAHSSFPDVTLFKRLMFTDSKQFKWHEKCAMMAFCSCLRCQKTAVAVENLFWCDSGADVNGWGNVLKLYPGGVFSPQLPPSLCDSLQMKRTIALIPSSLLEALLESRQHKKYTRYFNNDMLLCHSVSGVANYVTWLTLD